MMKRSENMKKDKRLETVRGSSKILPTKKIMPVIKKVLDGEIHKLRRQERKLRDELYGTIDEIQHGLKKRERACRIIALSIEKCIRMRLRDGMSSLKSAWKTWQRGRIKQMDSLKTLRRFRERLLTRELFQSLKAHLMEARKAAREKMSHSAKLIQSNWRKRAAFLKLMALRTHETKSREVVLSITYSVYRSIRLGQKVQLFRQLTDELDEPDQAATLEVIRRPKSDIIEKNKLLAAKFKKKNVHRPSSVLSVLRRDQIRSSKDTSARTIQSFIASQLQRIKFQLKRQAALCIQCQCRQYIARRFCDRTRQVFMIHHLKATRIQSVYRRHVAVMVVEVCRQQAFHARLDSLRINAAIAIQSLVRGAAARMTLQRHKSAVVIQRMGRCTRARQLRKLRMQQYLCRVEAAVGLQTRFRMMRTRKAYLLSLKIGKTIRQEAAVVIQCAWRCWSALLLRCELFRIQTEFGASLLIQKRLRMRMAIARRIRLEKEQSKRRLEASWFIQRIIRGYLVRCMVGRIRVDLIRQVSSVRIQCAYRMHYSRIEIAYRKLQFEDKLKRLEQNRLLYLERCKQVDMMNRNATMIQCAYRQTKARYMLQQKLAFHQQQTEALMVIKIQKVWRSKKVRLHLQREAMKIIHAELMSSYQADYIHHRLEQEWKTKLEEYLYKEREENQIAKEIKEENQRIKDLQEKETTKAIELLAAWEEVPGKKADGTENYFWNHISSTSDWNAPFGFLDEGREMHRKQRWMFPPTPAQIDAVNKGWVRIANATGNGIRYYNNQTFLYSDTKPVGFHEPATPQLDYSQPYCCLCLVLEADRRCAQCGPRLPYCLGCFFSSHKTESLRQHTCEIIRDTFDELPLEYEPEPVPEESPEYDGMCTQCLTIEATLLCEQCGDPMCQSCYNTLHAKGKLKDHPTMPYNGFLWDEYFDTELNSMKYFNNATKEFTKECPVELMYGPDRAAYLSKRKIEREVQAKQDELQALREEVEQLEIHRTRAVKADRERLQAVESYTKATSRTRKIAKFVAPALVNDDIVKEEQDDDDFEETRVPNSKFKRKVKARKLLSTRQAKKITNDPLYLQKMLVGKNKPP